MAGLIRRILGYFWKFCSQDIPQCTRQTKRFVDFLVDLLRKNP